jgi:hypothetical protein
MEERYEKKTFEWFISSLFRDYWHFLRYYFTSPEDCPKCQSNNADGDGEEA